MAGASQSTKKLVINQSLIPIYNKIPYIHSSRHSILVLVEIQSRNMKYICATTYFLSISLLLCFHSVCVCFLLFSFIIFFFSVEAHFIPLGNIVASHIRKDRSTITNIPVSKNPVGSDAPTGGDPQVTLIPPSTLYTVHV